mmetsp:Transcript_6476/g.10127  ORF Transcript_6476/g.10127 Transcript_6476/m.10127 type:complete len:109 (-) Transcript_6476:7-333(-)
MTDISMNILQFLHTAAFNLKYACPETVPLTSERTTKIGMRQVETYDAASSTTIIQASPMTKSFCQKQTEAQPIIIPWVGTMLLTMCVNNAVQVFDGLTTLSQNLEPHC